MDEHDVASWISVSVGIWNGSRFAPDGTLLYRKLLSTAVEYGLHGGTVWRVIEGGNRHGVFRSIESEVASNELPVWIQFIDQTPRVNRWLPLIQSLLVGKGVIVINRQLALGKVVSMTSDSNKTPVGEKNGQEDGISMSAVNSANESVVQHVTTPGLQITIYTLEKSKVNGKPLYQAVAEYLRQRNILWVATMRGLYGFGESRTVRQPGWLNKLDTPVMLVAADREEKLRPHLAGLVDLVGNEGFVVTSPVSWMEP